MKKDKNNSESYSWGDNCQGWHLVKTSSLSVIQETMPSGSEEVRHKHQKAQQFFFILKGIATFETETGVVLVKAGEGIHIHSEKAHKIKNESSEEIEFLVISEPHAHGDRVLME